MLGEKLQIVLLLTSILGVILTVYLIKKNMLELKYSFLWILLSIFSISLAVYPEIMLYISLFLGIQLPVNALFLFGFYFVLSILFSLTIIVSKNAKRVKLLNQELAILKNMVEEKNNE